MINTTGQASSSPTPRLYPPKSTEDCFTLLSEWVGENHKEEPEIVVAPLESATAKSGTATEDSSSTRSWTSPWNTCSKDYWHYCPCGIQTKRPLHTAWSDKSIASPDFITYDECVAQTLYNLEGAKARLMPTSRRPVSWMSTPIWSIRHTDICS